MVHGEARRCLNSQSALKTHCGLSLTPHNPPVALYKTRSLVHHFVRAVFPNSLI